MSCNWPQTALGDLVNFNTGRLDSNAAVENGRYPFFTCSPTTLAIDSFAFDTEAVLLAGNNANGIFPVKYYKGKFNAYQRTYVVTPKNTAILSPKWLYFRIKHVTAELQQMSVGSATKFLTKKILDAYTIPLPPIEDQQYQADVLWSLQDKLDTNHQINQTLEQMAQAIFKSWFVDFEPVKAKIAALEAGGSTADAELAAMQAISGKDSDQLQQMANEQPEKYAELRATAELFPSAMQESELGEVPEGWEATNFGAVSTCLDKHRIPLSKAQREKKKGNIPYYGATSVMDSVDEHIFDGVYLLLGEDGSVVKDDGTPFAQYVWGKIWVNNHAHVLQGANDVSTEQLMLFIKNTNIAPYVTGAVQLKLNQKNMNSIPFIKADKKLCDAFSEILKPVFSEFRIRYSESLSLKETRDALLPKLLSGSIKLEAKS